ncbi:MAG: KH domain-containing protein [Candidatus Levyibacteriota bacterium]|nr:MAG: KH domain-containing protein [Candidatus Levybacteria bacterium]
MAKQDQPVGRQGKTIEKVISDILKALEIEGEFSILVKEDVIEVSLETKDSGMVIGYHGEILESLQLILSLAVSKKIGEFIRVSIEVGDYKKNRTDWLENLAIQTKQQVLLERKKIAIPNLRSWERRIVHVYLQEDPDVLSESVGVGRDRTLVVRPRE